MGRHHASSGVTGRLVALVMLPVTMMCLLAGSVILSHRALAAQAIAVDRGVIGLTKLLDLREALYEEESVAAFDVRFAELGVARAAASTFLGFDVAARIPAARVEGREAVVALGARGPIPAGDLETLYAGLDAGAIGPVDAVTRLHAMLGRIEHEVTLKLDTLDVEARNSPLVAALKSLRATALLVTQSKPQGIDMSALWFPSPGETPQVRAATLARFGEESAQYSAAVARLRELGVKTVLAGLNTMGRDPTVQVFDASVTTSLLGGSLTGDSPELIAATFKGYIQRDSLIDELLKTATTAARDEARRLAATERAGFLAWTLACAALALGSIGVALGLARSISRPLKRLAGYAHAVNEGELDAEPAATNHRGPRETQVAFAVFAELVANLQLLDAKANALALCNFDDPALLEPLPGRLARSLESSVALLSGSIVERDQLQTHLAHQTTHDPLTGIGNRPAAITEIQAAMHRAERTGATTALLFIDLNHFKAVNDSHGHEVGDEVLRHIASRLTDDLRNADFVARLGGDEFIVVAEGITDVEGATDLARRVLDAVSRPIEVGPLEITVGAAVGVALTLDGPEEPLRLLARADAAMYRAKAHDGSAIEIFDAELQQQMIHRVDIETALSAALTAPDSGLQLYYQPVLGATSGGLVGAEALIRWDRPGHGMLPPDSFIPIAEASGLIIDVDCWVLRTACAQLVAWADVVELADVPVAVNISGRHLLSRQLPDHIRDALAESSVDPGRLTIEITETVLLTDLVVAAAQLDLVRAMGVKVAIDDFGTGYTSLAHLQHLPIDTIKIDRSFVSQLNVRRGSSLVRMVTDLGHAIDINIVAEGVETEDELHALQAMGADHLQGYLLSRPLTPAALSAWAVGRTIATPV